MRTMALAKARGQKRPFRTLAVLAVVVFAFFSLRDSYIVSDYLRGHASSVREVEVSGFEKVGGQLRGVLWSTQAPWGHWCDPSTVTRDAGSGPVAFARAWEGSAEFCKFVSSCNVLHWYLRPCTCIMLFLLLDAAPPRTPHSVPAERCTTDRQELQGPSAVPPTTPSRLGRAGDGEEPPANRVRAAP